MCADRNRFDEVGAAAERAVDDHLAPTSHRVDDLWEHLHRATAMVELSAAMARHINPFAALFDADTGILRRRDILEDKRNVVSVLDQLERAPG